MEPITNWLIALLIGCITYITTIVILYLTHKNINKEETQNKPQTTETEKKKTPPKQYGQKLQATGKQIWNKRKTN